MNDDLTDELAALDAIYAAPCLIPTDDDDAEIYSLQPPTSVISPQISLRVHIPVTYPAAAPTILDDGASTGVALAKETLDSVWREGEVCFFDLLEGLRDVLGAEEPESTPESEPVHELTPLPAPQEPAPPPPPSQPKPEPETEPEMAPRYKLPWVISQAIVEKRSTFIAHCLRIQSVPEMKAGMADLLADKKIAKATHNIMAYRFLNPSTGNTVHDNDDDGETAAGSRLAHLLDMMQVQDVLVVVSRWYGGVKLGPDRFRLINAAARAALVEGGWVKEPEDKKGGKKGKKK